MVKYSLEKKKSQKGQKGQLDYKLSDAKAVETI